MLDHQLEDHGHDRTVVLLHSLALDRSVWSRMVPLLSDRFNVLVPDLPGHGSSAPVQDVTIEHMGDEVAALIRDRGISGAVVVGLSLGGCVAQAVAVRHTDLVAGLGLVDTTCWYGETAPEDWEKRAQRAKREGLESLADFQLTRWFTPSFREEHPEVGQRLLEVFRRNDIDSYVATCRAMGAMDLREAVGDITAPTMIVVGEHDPATPPVHAEDLRDRIKGAGLEVLPDCSHLSAVERPDAVFTALEQGLLSRLG